MIKRFDKRGQEGVGMGAFLKLIIGIAAVVLVILGVYMYFQTVVSPIDVDVDLVLMEQSCSNFLTSGESFYCAGKYEAATDKFIGCKYAVESLGLVIDFPNGEPTCAGNPAEQICLKIQLERGLESFEGEKIYVNNKLCSDIIRTPAVTETTGEDESGIADIASEI